MFNFSCIDNVLVLERQTIFMTNHTNLDIIIMTVLLSIVGLCGVIGNGLVLMVCHIYPKQQSTRYFIHAMAVSDFMVCLVLIPYRITVYHQFVSEIVCKLFDGATHFTVLFSMIMLVALAVDKFCAVCHPLLYHRLHKQTKQVILVIAIATFCIAINSGLCAGHYVIIPDNTSMVTERSISSISNRTTPSPSYTEICYTGICIEDGEDVRFTTKMGIKLYNGFYGLIYFSLLLFVIVLYVKIFGKLYSRHRNKLQSLRHCGHAMQIVKPKTFDNRSVLVPKQCLSRYYAKRICRKRIKILPPFRC